MNIRIFSVLMVSILFLFSSSLWSKKTKKISLTKEFDEYLSLNYFNQRLKIFQKKAGKEDGDDKLVWSSGFQGSAKAKFSFYTNIEQHKKKYKIENLMDLNLNTAFVIENDYNNQTREFTIKIIPKKNQVIGINAIYILPSFANKKLFKLNNRLKALQVKYKGFERIFMDCLFSGKNLEYDFEETRLLKFRDSTSPYLIEIITTECENGYCKRMMQAYPDKPIEVMFSIKDVYFGEKWKDTVIGEIYFEGAALDTNYCKENR